MVLQSSGPIDFSDINVELGVAANTSRALGSASSRGLGGIASGAIRLGADFYGKSNAPPIQAIYMILGGGGGGGCNLGGGGGSGSIRTNLPSPLSSITIAAGSTSMTYIPGVSYSIAIGGGGSGQQNAPTTANIVRASNGANTTLTGPIGTLTGLGGGGGGFFASPQTPARGFGNSGGSGGGSTFYTNSGGASTANPAEIVHLGNTGGRETISARASRGGTGGGGILSAGGLPNASPATNKGGNGGDGATWAGIYSCGGGGGGGTGTLTGLQSPGGFGGGGLGTGSPGGPGNGGDGSPSTGGGGGGGRGLTPATRGGNGGSGAVIIGYPGPQKATGGSVSTSGPYVYHTFTGAGTFTWN